MTIQRTSTPSSFNRLLFDGSEYVKDGLMPITEWFTAATDSDYEIVSRVSERTEKYTGDQLQKGISVVLQAVTQSRLEVRRIPRDQEK